MQAILHRQGGAPLDRQVEALGYEAIWKKRYGEGLAVAYLERVGDPLIIELFENHAG